MLLLLLALAAQDTTCVQSGSTIKCREEKPLDVGAILRSGADMVPIYRAPVVDRSAALRQRIGRMVFKGDCAGAEKAALEAGDIDLASRVQDYCAKR